MFRIIVSPVCDAFAYVFSDNSSDIAQLNQIVHSKSLSFIKSSESSGIPLSPEVASYVATGEPVYKNRLNWFPVLVGLIGIFLIFSNVNSLVTLMACALLSFLWYDFYSGCLHVVLDNPTFIDVPLLGPPCLEFQWHHHIPTDLASKKFLQVCGDLNVVVAIIAGIFLFACVFFDYDTPLLRTLLGFKVLMAYFGQYCHCMSHTVKSKRPAIVNSLQNWGFMISPSEHHKHHQDHSTNFCIGSGFWNPSLSFIYSKISSNKWLWLAFFLVSSVADVPVMNSLLVECALN